MPLQSDSFNGGAKVEGDVIMCVPYYWVRNPLPVEAA